MTRRQILASISAASLASVLDKGTPAGAQSVGRATRILVGAPAGVFTDTVARLLINQMKAYAPTMILENKPGGAQRVALEALKNSLADGSTMMLAPAGAIVLYPHIDKTLSYKPLDDFIPVTTVFDTPSSLVVGPLVPHSVRTIAEFAGWCRANPTRSVYGSPGAGSPMHFLGGILAKAAQFEYVHVPYQSSNPAVQDVLGGQIASAIVPIPAVVQLTEARSLRVLATTGPERSPSLPDVPTVKEAGYPALEFSEWFGILLPAKAPSDVVTSLNAAVRRAMRAQEFKVGLARLSLEPAESSMTEFAQRIRADFQRWERVVKASGFVSQ
jgi:tripartite-type tricarboxylate transporter receptor subunit TctC